MIPWFFKKNNYRQARHHRLRGRIKGTAERPRLFVFRSHKHIYAQLIDDSQSKIIVSASDMGMKKKSKAELAQAVGQAIAEKAKTKEIKKVVFDRGGYKYHGRVKAVAEGARAEGLDF
jgi:large subunit ribosomal protein L18